MGAKMRKIPIPIVTSLLLLAVLGLGRLLAWHFFGVEIEKTELLSVLGIGTSGGVLYRFLPLASRRYVVSGLRRYLSSRLSIAALSVISIALLLPLFLISHIDIAWRGPARLPVQINSRQQVLDADDLQKDLLQARRLGLSFTTIDVNIENWHQKKRLYPLVTQVMHIPFSVSNASAPEIAEIEDQLEMAFFQFSEARFLAIVKNKLPPLVQHRLLHQAVARLELIYEIIRIDFLEIDLSDRKTLLLEDFIKRYPDDPWSSLLHAANMYGKKDYAACAAILQRERQASSRPKAATIDFFRGVCLLKASRDAGVPDTREALNRQASSAFQQSEITLQHENEGTYRNLALPSAIHFQGISNYYRGHTDETVRHFRRARDAASGSLKARALNGLGYISLSKGNLNEAEMDFLDAMENDPTYPLARSNYGYVLMGKGELDKAKEYFSKNASNDRLKVESYRDVVLAKLALVHLQELRGVDHAHVIGQYETILSELKMQTFDGVMPDSFRLANIHRSIAKNVYLSKEYYGLEIYALALLTRAHLEAQESLVNGNPDVRIGRLLGFLSTEIKTTESMVGRDWLNRPQSGWFGTIENYQKVAAMAAASATAHDAAH